MLLVLLVLSQFEKLIMKIAGDSNAGFLDIESGLGYGFYILIVYSVVAGFLHYSLRVRRDNSSDTDLMKDDALIVEEEVP
jgi:hypothetical protein